MTHLVKNMEPARALAGWINERYRMHICKEAAEAMNKEFPNQEHPAKAGLKYGWSDDYVMGTTRWCNVHREHDAVTKWMRQNWTSHDSPLWWFCLGRFLNYIPTLEAMAGVGDDLELIRRNLKWQRDSGAKVFTSAYTISTCGVSMDKIDYVIMVMERIVAKFGQEVCPKGIISLEEMHEELMQVKGLGSFLAAQVVADMKNTPKHPMYDADDWYTWAAPGPGSMRGLEAYFGAKVSLQQFMPLLRRVKTEVEPLLAPMPPICMQDMQNCMCEFSKYVKLTEGRGHARNRYTAA